MEQIGITEAGEVAFNLDIFNKLKDVNIIITKRLTPALIDKLIENKDKIILHLTVTGMGGSRIEPLVPTKEISKNNFDILIEKGFPIEQVVLRIDPIIPTLKGIKTALNVIELFKDSGIKRLRFSSLDMYKHVKERFVNEDIKLPYGTFHANYGLIQDLYKTLKKKCDLYNIEIEACAEEVPAEAKVGCISQKDVDILNKNIALIGSSEQRKGCLCPANKIELITGSKPHRCANKCLYCFWKDN